MTLERGRDICLRNLLRKVYIACKDDEGNQRTRIRVAEFGAAIRLAGGSDTDSDVDMQGGGTAMDSDEVECLLANQIYKVSKNFQLRAAADEYRT